MITNLFDGKFFYRIIPGVFLFFFSFGCSRSQYYEIRAQFLRPVNYTGSLCRLSDETLQKFFTRKPAQGDPGFVREISRILGREVAWFAISVYDPDSGYTIQLNRDLAFHAASTYKAAILVALLRMDQEHALKISDKVLLENKFYSVVDSSLYQLGDDPDEPDETFTKIGKEVSIRSLLDIMIEKSSNLATNALVKHVGAEKINDTLKSLGLQITVVRGVSDDRAYYDCINNVVTAGRLETLYKIIFDETKLDRQHRKIALDILEKNTESNRLAGKLPPEVRVAHKPGNTSKVFHDAGIVVDDSTNPYYIAILTSGYRSEKKTAGAIAEVSRLVYEEILKARKNIAPQ